MEKRNHNERIKKASENHVELMDLTFRMHMTEEVDFNKVMELIREIYKDQLTLINMLRTYESDDPSHIENKNIQVPEFTKGGAR